MVRFLSDFRYPTHELRVDTAPRLSTRVVILILRLTIQIDRRQCCLPQGPDLNSAKFLKYDLSSSNQRTKVIEEPNIEPCMSSPCQRSRGEKGNVNKVKLLS